MKKEPRGLRVGGSVDERGATTADGGIGGGALAVESDEGGAPSGKDRGGGRSPAEDDGGGATAVGRGGEV